MNFLAPTETIDQAEAKIPFSARKYPKSAYKVYWETIVHEQREEKTFRAEVRIVGYADFEYRESKVFVNKDMAALEKSVQEFIEGKMPSFRRS